jgi:8-oxo-dGTP pyrophosphatase MutT (NUDIX family)
MSRATRAGCILINSRSEILVVHNVASNMWGFPKGRREPHETYTEAAIRELREEAGVILDAKNIASTISSGRDKLFVARGDFNPKCTVDGIECDQYDWITIGALKQRHISNFTKRFITRLEPIILEQ